MVTGAENFGGGSGFEMAAARFMAEEPWRYQILREVPVAPLKQRTAFDEKEVALKMDVPAFEATFMYIPKELPSNVLAAELAGNPTSRLTVEERLEVVLKRCRESVEEHHMTMVKLTEMEAKKNNLQQELEHLKAVMARMPSTTEEEEVPETPPRRNRHRRQNATAEAAELFPPRIKRKLGPWKVTRTSCLMSDGIQHTVFLPREATYEDTLSLLTEKGQLEMRGQLITAQIPDYHQYMANERAWGKAEI